MAKDTDAARRVREYVLDHPGPIIPGMVVDACQAKPTTVHSALARLAEAEPGLLRRRSEGGRYAGFESLAPRRAPIDEHPRLKQADGLTIVGDPVEGVYAATDDATGHLWAVVPARITLGGAL
jgi:hypothetical protein